MSAEPVVPEPPKEPRRKKAEPPKPDAIVKAEPVALAPKDDALATREDFSGFQAASTLVVPEETQKKLTAILPDDDHDILPTGEVYVTQVRYRRILNDAFGVGQWALVPRSAETMHGNTVCQKWALFVRGHFVSEAWGEQEYIASNDRMTYATAAEAAKSNALTRCCKDLGIGSECWDKRWANDWRAKYAIQVWRQGEKKPQWRRKDAEPFWNETGPVVAKNGGQQQPPPAQAQRPSTPAQPPPPSAPAPPQAPDKINSNQRGLFWTVAKEKGWSEPEARVIVRAVARVESTSDIPKVRFDHLLACLESNTVLAGLRAYIEDPSEERNTTLAQLIELVKR